MVLASQIAAMERRLSTAPASMANRCVRAALMLAQWAAISRPMGDPVTDPDAGNVTGGRRLVAMALGRYRCGRNISALTLGGYEPGPWRTDLWSLVGRSGPGLMAG